MTRSRRRAMDRARALKRKSQPRCFLKLQSSCGTRLAAGRPPNPSTRNATAIRHILQLFARRVPTPRTRVLHGDEAGDGDGDGDKGWRALAGFPGLVLHAPTKRPRASTYASTTSVSVPVAAWGRLLFWDWMTMGIATSTLHPYARPVVIEAVSTRGSHEAYWGAGVFFYSRTWGWGWRWIWKVAGAGAERKRNAAIFFRACACPSLTVLPLKRAHVSAHAQCRFRCGGFLFLPYSAAEMERRTDGEEDGNARRAGRRVRMGTDGYCANVRMKI
ncbi:hypothetical protein C8F04DRAFT_1315128 [Mycena alexandri]|uniref:Uncharacterized protein n=1 Tax=Mycena alexandri TaxID=1745969 RepID=A0AAD6X5Q9_9AGAR|nr:hypothetical protein C8F04DRAFT_1315128 [Mycena alexandri]